MEVSGRYLAAATTWPFLPPPISPDHLDGAGGGWGEKEPSGRWLNMSRLVCFLHRLALLDFSPLYILMWASYTIFPVILTCLFLYTLFLPLFLSSALHWGPGFVTRLSEETLFKTASSNSPKLFNQILLIIVPKITVCGRPRELGWLEKTIRKSPLYLLNTW